MIRSPPGSTVGPRAGTANTMPRDLLASHRRPPFVTYNTTSGSFYGYLVDLLPTLLSVAGLDASGYSLNLVSTNLPAGLFYASFRFATL